MIEVSDPRIHTRIGYPYPSLCNIESPLLLLITAAVVLMDENLASEDGSKFAGEAETGFLTNGWDLNSGTESPPLDKEAMEDEEDDV